MNILDFKKMKDKKQKISMVTCYDYWSANILNDTSIDSILVGDSLSMIVYGHDSTIHATEEMMSAHTQAVSKGAPNKFVISDMPFLSVRKDLSFAMNTVEKLVRAGAKALKIEGVTGHEKIIKHIVESGIPVMGHLGLTPQSILKLGGFKVQGKNDAAELELIEQAKKFEKLGCFSIVIECVPESVASNITKTINIPTIGIGAGSSVDGQVLVLQDLLGINSNYFNPRFVRTYLDGNQQIKTAIEKFHIDIREKAFPQKEESYQ